jgi:hypothetical protein
MATSNWQHISYCCELMFALAPRSILDVGMGFGRWGILAREMCDIWRQRVFPEQWQVQIVGVEAYGKLVRDYHRAFYNEVIVRDAAQVLEGAARCFDEIVDFAGVGQFIDTLLKRYSSGMAVRLGFICPLIPWQVTRKELAESASGGQSP